MKDFLAQLPDVNIASALVVYGPMAVVLCWFMFRGEKQMDGVITELRVLGHRINGMTRAMLADVASREATSDALRTLVQGELHKLEDEDDVKDMRARKKG